MTEIERELNIFKGDYECENSQEFRIGGMAYLSVITRIQETDERFAMMIDFLDFCYTNRIYFTFDELRGVASTFLTFFNNTCSRIHSISDPIIKTDFLSSYNQLRSFWKDFSNSTDLEPVNQFEITNNC